MVSNTPRITHISAPEDKDNRPKTPFTQHRPLAFSQLRLNTPIALGI